MSYVTAKLEAPGMQDLKFLTHVNPALLEESEEARKALLMEIVESLHASWLMVAEDRGWPREEEDPHLAEYLP